MHDTKLRMGYGALRLTGPGAFERTVDRPAAIALLRRVVDSGITFIDTADSYGLGDNEELIAEALHPFPENLIIGTKAGQARPDHRRWVPLGRPEYLRQQAYLSLRRLRVDRLDLFQLHRIDPKVPFEEQIGALHELREEGVIARVGLSEITVDELEAARRITPIDTVQNLYNAADRSADPLVDRCEELGITFLPWLPVANGTPGAAAVEVARDLGVTPVQASLAWLLHRSPVILPIPGTTSPEHLAENVAAAGITLNPDHLRRFDV
ncbi:aldo/keto reductase [Virgisporangium aliadipatigenens]|nr:aldo/keto reductase [Virgisporangium aliadipatigenens]